MDASKLVRVRVEIDVVVEADTVTEAKRIAAQVGTHVEGVFERDSVEGGPIKGVKMVGVSIPATT
jgi:hypothetical protein